VLKPTVEGQGINIDLQSLNASSTTYATMDKFGTHLRTRCTDTCSWYVCPHQALLHIPARRQGSDFFR
jgi:hypothetical protein